MKLVTVMVAYIDAADDASSLLCEEYADGSPFAGEPKAVIPIAVDDHTAELLAAMTKLVHEMDDCPLAILAHAAFKAGRIFGRNER